MSRLVPGRWQVDGVFVGGPEGQGLRSNQGRREVVEGGRAEVGGDVADVGVGADVAAVAVLAAAIDAIDVVVERS